MSGIKHKSFRVKQEYPLDSKCIKYLLIIIWVKYEQN